MNRILVFLVVTISTNLMFSQTENISNFEVIDNEITWTKIIEITTSPEDYIQNLKLEEFFNNLDWKDSPIAGQSNKKDLKIKSPYWASFPFDCFIKMEFKENRCRISFSNITFDGPSIELYGVSDKMQYKLSDIAQKNGKFKTSKKNNSTLSDLNSFFEKITSENKTDKNSDW